MQQRLASSFTKRGFGSKTHCVESYDLKKFGKYMLLPSLGFGAKYMVGDWIAQNMNDKKDFNWKRNVQWGMFGLGMSLAFYSPLWTKVYPRFINRYKYGNVGVATFQTIGFEPFLFMPCFYLASAIFNEEFDNNLIPQVYEKWKKNFKTDLCALTMYGAPVFGLNTTVIPVNFRSWWVTLCGIVFSAVIIYCKVDATSDDILLPQSAFLYSTVPLLLDFTAEDRYQLLEKSKLKPISLAEFEHHCNENHPGFKQLFVRKLFNIMDTESNGFITAEDAEKYFQSASLVLDNREKLLEWFDYADRSKDGVLSKEEVFDALQQFFHDETVLAIFEQMDHDRNGVVCKNDFTIHFATTVCKNFFGDNIFSKPSFQLS